MLPGDFTNGPVLWANKPIDPPLGVVRVLGGDEYSFSTFRSWSSLFEYLGVRFRTISVKDLSSLYTHQPGASLKEIEGFLSVHDHLLLVTTNTQTYAYSSASPPSPRHIASLGLSGSGSFLIDSSRAGGLLLGNPFLPYEARVEIRDLYAPHVQLTEETTGFLFTNGLMKFRDDDRLLRANVYRYLQTASGNRHTDLLVELIRTIASPMTESPTQHCSLWAQSYSIPAAQGSTDILFQAADAHTHSLFTMAYHLSDFLSFDLELEDTTFLGCRCTSILPPAGVIVTAQSMVMSHGLLTRFDNEPISQLSDVKQGDCS